MMAAAWQEEPDAVTGAGRSRRARGQPRGPGLPPAARRRLDRGGGGGLPGAGHGPPGGRHPLGEPDGGGPPGPGLLRRHGALHLQQRAEGLGGARGPGPGPAPGGPRGAPLSAAPQHHDLRAQGPVRGHHRLRRPSPNPEPLLRRLRGAHPGPGLQAPQDPQQPLPLPPADPATGAGAGIRPGPQAGTGGRLPGADRGVRQRARPGSPSTTTSGTFATASSGSTATWSGSTVFAPGWSGAWPIRSATWIGPSPAWRHGSPRSCAGWVRGWSGWRTAIQRRWTCPSSTCSRSDPRA